MVAYQNENIEGKFNILFHYYLSQQQLRGVNIGDNLIRRIYKPIHMTMVNGYNIRIGQIQENYDV